MSSDSRNDLDFTCWWYFDFLGDAIQFGWIALENNKLDNILSFKDFLLSFKNRHKINRYFFRFGKINSRLNFLKHLFDHKSELIHLFSTQENTLYLSIWVINSHIYSSTFRIEEANNSFEKNLFKELLLEGEGIVF